MLRGFVDAQADMVVQVRSALAADDRQTAVRLAHALKGLAGNIAAPELVRTALALEHALRTGLASGELAQQIDQLESNLSAQVTAIRGALGSDAGYPAALTVDQSTPDPQQLASICQKLSLLLANDDGNAERLFAEYANMLHMAFPKHFSDLQAAINSFDSERGLLILQKAMADSAH